MLKQLQDGQNNAKNYSLSHHISQPSPTTILLQKLRNGCLILVGSKHCTNNSSLLLGENDCPGDVLLAASGNKVSYSIAGDVLIQSEDCGRYYFLKTVVYLPGAGAGAGNIISVRKFLLQESCLAQCSYNGFLLRDTRYINMVSPEYILAKGPILNIFSDGFILSIQIHHLVVLEY